MELHCPNCNYSFEPDQCEHCGYVDKAYNKDGTTWCALCMEANGWEIPSEEEVDDE